MRRLVLSLVLSAAAPMVATAQGGADSSRTAILAVVNRLFEGMKKGDSAMVRSVFHPRASLASVRTRGTAPIVVSFDSVSQFARAVGTPHAEVWNETTNNEIVHVDGGMATVWAPYEFHLGTKFSHCGVDSFQFVRTPEGWKIVALIDTRQPTGCPGR